MTEVRSLEIFYSYYTFCWSFLTIFNLNKIEYQMLVLAHIDLGKYEATMGFQETSLLFVCKRD